MKKRQFIELCKTDPEEVYKLFCMMGQAITTLQSQVIALNAQAESLQHNQGQAKDLRCFPQPHRRRYVQPHPWLHLHCQKKFGIGFFSHHRCLSRHTFYPRVLVFFQFSKNEALNGCENQPEQLRYFLSMLIPDIIAPGFGNHPLGGKRSYVGLVERRGDFNHVKPDDRQGGKMLQECKQFAG